MSYAGLTRDDKNYFNTSSYLNKETAKSPFNLGGKTELFDVDFNREIYLILINIKKMRKRIRLKLWVEREIKVKVF